MIYCGSLKERKDNMQKIGGIIALIAGILALFAAATLIFWWTGQCIQR